VNIELRGTIRAALATSTLEVPVPAAGLPLSQLLELIADKHPRARRYLQQDPGAAFLRAVHNGTSVSARDDPPILPQDRLLLIHAMSGGSA
jgi:hypothetical protein